MPIRGQCIPALTRFWRHLERRGPDECWPWVGAMSSKGYGWFKLDPRGEPMGAHRAAWLLLIGAIPDGLMVCHRCDNPQCVNPAHLFLGTAADNARDMWAKGRASYNGKKGETHYAAKLTADQVREIRRRYSAGGIFMYALAEEYRINQSVVSKIVNNKAWKSIGGI